MQSEVEGLKRIAVYLILKFVSVLVVGDNGHEATSRCLQEGVFYEGFISIFWTLLESLNLFFKNSYFHSYFQELLSFRFDTIFLSKLKLISFLKLIYFKFLLFRIFCVYNFRVFFIGFY